MKIGALVPARGNSKRLAGKNTIDLGGRPLVAWTLDVLLESGVFSDITVSTESDEVAGVVRRIYGDAIRILKRPEELSGDDSPLTEVRRHYLEQTPGLDWCGTFLPTYPFRTRDRLLALNSVMQSGYPSRILSVNAQPLCTWDFFYPVDDGFQAVFVGEPVLTGFTSSCYVFQNLRYQELAAKGRVTRRHERVHRVHISPAESVDIDTREDYAEAQAVIRNGCVAVRNLVRHDYGDWEILLPEGLPLDGFVSLVGEKLFRDSRRPIGILVECRYPLSHLMWIDEALADIAFNSNAPYYLDYSRTHETQNGQLSPICYLHHQNFRIFRKPRNLASPAGYLDSDLFGLGFGAANRFLESDRVVDGRLVDRWAAQYLENRKPAVAEAVGTLA